MKTYSKIYPIICTLLALISCDKEPMGESYVEEEKAIRFSVEQIDQTRVTYGDQTNGGLSATFDVGDNVGLFAYYNNYYVYYNEYGCFAESVILHNHGAVISASGEAEYTTLRSWTFSTMYGTAPYTLDCVGYYPFIGSDPKYVDLINDGTTPTLIYYYYQEQYTDESGNTVKAVTNFDRDFMTAHTRYSYNQTDSESGAEVSDPDTFRTEMLALDYIPLTFTRQTASLNLQVTKPDGETDKIEVTGVTFYFDAPDKFSQKITAGEVTPVWSEDKISLEAYIELETAVELSETNWDATPDSSSSNVVADLLDDGEIFLPPTTEINKVVFDITINDVDEERYTWHPHVAEIKANTHYTLNLELDPARDN